MFFWWTVSHRVSSVDGSTPCLPHYSVYMWREAFTDLGIGWVSDRDKISRAVEELNRMAIVGDVIKSENGVWYIPACL